MSLYQAASFFLIYSFVGWVVEVVYHVVKQGKVINRGYLNGPVCPIYGIGMLAIMEAIHFLPDMSLDTGLRGVTDHSWMYSLIIFFGGMILSTIVELIGGWVLFHFFKQRWWDYSKEPFNLGGYICLRFSIVWGIGAVIAMDVVHPIVSKMVGHKPTTISWVVIAILYVIYLVDVAATTVTVMKMKKDFERLDQMGAAMREVSDALTQKIGDTTFTVQRRVDETKLQAALGKAELRDKVQESQENIGRRVSETKSELGQRVSETKSELGQRVSETKSELGQRVSETKSELSQRVSETRAGLEQRVDETKLQMALGKAELKSRYDDLQSKRDALRSRMSAHPLFGSGRILKAFPNLTARRIEEMQEAESAD